MQSTITSAKLQQVFEALLHHCQDELQSVVLVDLASPLKKATIQQLCLLME